MTYKFFDSLKEAKGAKEIREKVFVEEQGFYNEFDELDNKALHLEVYEDDKAIACGRLYQKEDTIYAIGRVGVLKEYRGQHYGALVIDLLEQKCKQLGASRIEASAQVYAAGFYEKKGFKRIGEEYLDETCPHITVYKDIKKPIIGILGIQKINEEGVFAGEKLSYVPNDYIEAVEKCDGVPMIIPTQSNVNNIKSLINMVNGIILTGGNDIDPLLYNENPINGLGLTIREVDDFYMDVIKCADKLGKPILGICKGHQALNVAFGGTLYQDLNTQKKDSFKHFQNTLRYESTHAITIEKENILHELFGEHLLVNSFHHQAIKDLSDDFKVLAYSEDGVIEAIEKKEGTYMLGIQWHPEMMITVNNENMMNLFEAFMDKCC